MKDEKKIEPAEEEIIAFHESMLIRDEKLGLHIELKSSECPMEILLSHARWIRENFFDNKIKQNRRSYIV